MLVSVVEGEWFATLVSDSPGSGRTRRLLFREEAVAALATTCAQVGGRNCVLWGRVGTLAGGRCWIELFFRVMAEVERAVACGQIEEGAG